MTETDENHGPPEVSELAHWVQWSLLGGLLASSALLLIGLTVAMVKHQRQLDTKPPALSVMLERAAGGDGGALLDVGILLLLATPIARVVVLAIGWTLARDYRMALVALCVLTLLAVSVLLGVG